MSVALERSYHRAEMVTASWARSFYFASRFLPAEKKRAIFALYDYCRHADNLVDARGDRSAELARRDLENIGREVTAMHGGAPASSDRWLALADTLHRYEIPLGPLLDLLDGVAMDLERVEFQDYRTLHNYCRLVAGGVGLMLGPILGASSDRYHEAGIRLGVAMQLTNILRDVGEDLANDRVYLPVAEMAQFGIVRATLERRRVTPEFRRFMAWQVQRARRYFEHGNRVVALFPNDGSRLTVRLLQRTYAGILDAIERMEYDVFEARAHVSTPRKLLVLGRAMWSERPRMQAVPAERSI
jgi:15-cis-phytoene synthase